MGRLEVRICGARNIGDTQKVGIPDPYVKIIMGDNKKTQIKYKTKVVNNSLNPVWNETAKFQIADYDSAQVIFEVWNDNVMVDDLMGNYALSVNGLQRGVVQDMWAILTGTRLSSAEIHLQVLAVDFGANPQPGSRVVSSIEEYITTAAAAPKPVMSATETAGVSSPASADFDPAKKPAPVMGIPLQAPAPTYVQQPQPQPQQQQVYYAPQQPMQYMQPQPQQQLYPSQPQQQYVYVLQPYAPPPPQPQQVVYVQQPPPQQQPMYYQQGPPPPPQPGYYGPSAPQPNYYGPPHL